MLEQEMASIIKYVLESTDNPAPYYWKIPEDFAVPAAYFPRPEIISGADTLSSYSLDYAWYITFFASTDEDAHSLAWTAVNAIREERNLIPLIDEDGAAISGKYVRIDDPSMKPLDTGACQMTISWTSRKPYNAEDSEKMMTYEINSQN